MTLERNYRAAVIGLGFVGAGDQVSGDALGQRVEDLDGTHAYGLARHPRVDLVAGASRDPGRRQRFTERLGVTATYQDWREMLEKETLDIVSVASYTPYHAEITIACAEAGIRAIYCEKPIATRLRDADRMIEACRERGSLLVINHNRRWNPFFRAVRECVAAGGLGELAHGFCRWSSGRLGNVGTHIFDAVRMVLGREAEAVSGTLDTTGRPDCRGPWCRDPGGWGVIRLAGGVKVFVDAAETIAVPFDLQVAGSEGEIICRGKNPPYLVRWSGQSEPLPVAKVEGTAVDRAVDEIVHCLDTGAAPSSSGEDGRAALEIILGFHVSDRQGGAWVELPLTGADRDLEVRSG